VTDAEHLPLVSVITPSLNQGRFIRACIESVRSQDYPRIEHIVMDGGSTDETLDVLRSYGDRLLWRSGPDSGQAEAVNAGCRLARGGILGWLNSDDAYLPGAVSAAVEHLSAHPDVAVVYGEAYYIDPNGAVIGVYPTEDFSLHRLSQACFICQPTAFIRRSALETTGMLDPSLQYCMDYELWIRLGRRYRFERIPRFLANSRRHADSKSFALRNRCFEEIYAVAKRSFGSVSPHWRATRAYYRVVDVSWPLARWVLWPARRLLPDGLRRWLRKQFPILLDGVTARRVRTGANS
jgi:glycosyltransferase involved in cell wall biosynthesis